MSYGNITEGVTIESGIGACPVEYCGEADGKPYYFRARGRHWEFSIAETESLAVEACIYMEARREAHFYACGKYGTEPFDASWMNTQQAQEIITGCVAVWRVARVRELQEGCK